MYIVYYTINVMACRTFSSECRGGDCSIGSLRNDRVVREKEHVNKKQTYIADDFVLLVT